MTLQRASSVSYNIATERKEQQTPETHWHALIHLAKGHWG